MDREPSTYADVEADRAWHSMQKEFAEHTSWRRSLGARRTGFLLGVVCGGFTISGLMLLPAAHVLGACLLAAGATAGAVVELIAWKSS